MTLALKSWLEVQRRLLIGLLGWGFMLVMFFVASRGQNPARPQGMKAVSPLCWVEIVMVMVFGALLAGSGVTTQMCNAAAARMPDSVLFTLSLPVSRRQLFRTRAVLGGFAALFLMVLFWLLLPVLLTMIAARPPFRLLLVALPFQLVTALFAYSLGLLGSALLSDVAMAWTMGAAGGLGGIGAGLEWPPLSHFLNFASGASYMTSGHISWTGVVVCLALSAVFISAAVRTIERREF